MCSHCSSEAVANIPEAFDCSEYHLCEAIAGEILEIEPDSEVLFTYRVVEVPGIQFESEFTLTNFLGLNVTAGDHDKHIMCVSNTAQDHYCYKLHIECMLLTICAIAVN